MREAGDKPLLPVLPWRGRRVYMMPRGWIEELKTRVTAGKK